MAPKKDGRNADGARGTVFAVGTKWRHIGLSLTPSILHSLCFSRGICPGKNNLLLASSEARKFGIDIESLERMESVSQRGIPMHRLKKDELCSCDMSICILFLSDLGSVSSMAIELLFLCLRLFVRFAARPLAR